MECLVADCIKPVKTRGWCQTHYMRFWRHGDAELLLRSPNYSPSICGHPDRKVQARGMCASCYTKQWIKEHPDANSGNNWSRNHPEASRLLKRRAALKKRGLSLDDFKQLWIEQGGKCANPMCSAQFELDIPDFRAALHVDHDHKTNLIRGLLCSGCNGALGRIQDDVDRLMGLIIYLESCQYANKE